MAGGEYPFWVAIQGNNTAYVTSERDREVDVVNISPAVDLNRGAGQSEESASVGSENSASNIPEILSHPAIVGNLVNSREKSEKDKAGH